MDDADAKPGRLRRNGVICVVALAACALGDLLQAAGVPVGQLFVGLAVGLAVALALGVGSTCRARSTRWPRRSWARPSGAWPRWPSC